PLRIEPANLVERYLVVTDDADIERRVNFPQPLHEVVRERIVVIDQQDHSLNIAQPGAQCHCRESGTRRGTRNRKRSAPVNRGGPLCGSASRLRIRALSSGARYFLAGVAPADFFADCGRIFTGSPSPVSGGLGTGGLETGCLPAGLLAGGAAFGSIVTPASSIR